MNKDLNSGELLLTDNKNTSISVLTFVSLFLLLAAFICIYFFSIIPISGTSMENTLHDNQYCLIQRNNFTVNFGDIVTINTANDKDEEHIVVKRVVGISGDKLLFMYSEDTNFVDLYICKAGETKFKLQNEDYIKEKMLRLSPTYTNVTILPYISKLTTLDVSDENFSTKYKIIENSIISVPTNHIFFLGDNRNNSRDSRFYGTRDLSAVTGKILYTF